MVTAGSTVAQAGGPYYRFVYTRYDSNPLTVYSIDVTVVEQNGTQTVFGTTNYDLDGYMGNLPYVMWKNRVNFVVSPGPAAGAYGVVYRQPVGSSTRIYVGVLNGQVFYD